MADNFTDANFFFKKPADSIFTDIKARRKLVGSPAGAVRKTGFVEIYGVSSVAWHAPMTLPAEEEQPDNTTFSITKKETKTISTDGKHFKILPVGASTIDNTYSGTTGKAVPTLGTVTIEVDGEFGSLRRATAEFTCYDMDSFDKLEKLLLRPGQRIFIRYGYKGADKVTEQSQGLVTLSNETKAYEFVICDYSFTYTKENHIKCSFKAIGVGGLSTSVNLSNTVSGGNRKFLRDFNDATSEVPVSSIEDVFDYHLIHHLIGVGNNVDSIGRGKTKVFSTSTDGYATPSLITMIKLPQDYEIADAIVETNWSNTTYMAYCSLSYIIHHLINVEILRNSPVNLVDNFKNIRYICNGKVSAGSAYKGYIYSADPLNIAITSNYATQNLYGPEGKDTAFNFAQAQIPTAYQTLKDGSPRVLDCSMILVSRILLRKLLKEFSKDKFSINDFLTKLFDVISDATAGMVTLALYEPDLDLSDYDAYSQKGSYTPMLVKNLKQRPQSIPERVEFDPLQGDGITRSCEVTAKVPKDMAAEAFGRNTPGKTGGTGTDGGQISQVLDKSKITTTTTHSDIIKLIDDLKQKVYPENKLSGVAVTDGKALLKDIMNEYIPLESRLQSEQILYPLEMKLVLDGIEGFRFGDHVTTTNIPNVYRNQSGMRVGFTVLRTTHTIAGNDWSTELTTIARLIG